MSRHKAAGRYSREAMMARERRRMSQRIAGKDINFLGKNVAKGSKLHGKLEGRPMIVMGNAYSLNEMPVEMCFNFPTLGCNRCLEMKQHPDFFTVVDRAPYMEQLERIKKYKGVRILSETLFDPKVSCRRTSVQDLPEYEWYRYRAVASTTPFPKHTLDNVFTYYSNDKRVSRGRLPAVQTNLDEFMPSGANIAYCMLQIALAMGANPIGIAGVDMSWPKDKKKTHFFGEGKKRGAFPFNTKRVMQFFAAAAAHGRRHGVKIFNLSPKGVLSPTFERITIEAFSERFERYKTGDRVRAGQFIQFEPDKNLQLSGTGMHGRSKQDIKKYYSGNAADSRRRRTRAGSPKNKPKSSSAAAVARKHDRRRKAAKQSKRKRG